MLRQKNRLIYAVCLVLTSVIAISAWYIAISAFGNDSRELKSCIIKAAENEKKGIWIDALSCYERAIELKPSSAEYRLCAANSCLMLDKKTEAKKYCRSAISADASAKEAYEMLAEILASEEDYSGAAEIIAEAESKGVTTEKLSELKAVLKTAYTEKYTSYDSFLGWHDTGTKSLGVFISRGKYGLMAKNGKKKLKAIYDELGMYDFETGLIPCKAGESRYYADISGNRKLVPDQGYTSLGAFGSGFAPVCRSDGNWGYIDTELNEYNFIYKYAGTFSGGIAAVQEKKGWRLIGTDFLPVSGMYYELILTDAYGFALHYGLAVGYRDGGYYLIDSSGHEINRTGFEKISLPASSDGLIAVKKEEDGQWTYTDRRGSEIFSIECDAAESFSCGMAAVMIDGKWGYISESGTPAGDFEYTSAGSFSSEGCASVEKNYSRYFITLCLY